MVLYGCNVLFPVNSVCSFFVVYLVVFRTGGRRSVWWVPIAGRRVQSGWRRLLSSLGCAAKKESGIVLCRSSGFSQGYALIISKWCVVFSFLLRGSSFFLFSRFFLCSFKAWLSGFVSWSATVLLYRKFVGRLSICLVLLRTSFDDC